MRYGMPLRDKVNHFFSLCLEFITENSLIFIGIENQLDKLKPVANSYSAKDCCLNGTRVDVLTQIREWASLGDSNVFWVHGPAGSGKSTISASVALMLESSLGGTFFCKRDDELRRKATNILPTLVFRLAVSVPDFGRHVAEVMKKEGNLEGSVMS